MKKIYRKLFPEVIPLYVGDTKDFKGTVGKAIHFAIHDGTIAKIIKVDPTVLHIREYNIFENIGFEKGKYKYLIRTADMLTNPRMSDISSWELLQDMPSIDMLEDQIFRWIINVAAVKKQVDDGIKSLE